MNSSVQHSGNKIGKSNVWINNSLAKTVSALDEFKSGFPSNGLTTVSNKWWGSSTSEDESENTEEHANGDEDEAVLEKQDSLVAIRKKIAEEGREALRKGFTSRTQDKKGLC